MGKRWKFLLSRLCTDSWSASLGVGPKRERKKGAGGIAWSSGGWVTSPTLGGTLGSSLSLLEMQDVLGEGARVLRASTV